MNDRSPLISVVIPTYRRWERLQRTLQALEAQTLPPDRFEVIVSDDGSADGTYEALQEYATRTPLRLVPITGPNAGPSTARNRGIARAGAPWVAMTDDDCLPAPDWLGGHLDFLAAHPELDAVGGAIVRCTDSLLSRYVDWSDAMAHHRLRDGTVAYLVTANAVYRRSLLEKLGGFATSFKWPGGEDPDLSRRAREQGAVLGVNPGAVVRHMHRETVRDTYRMFWHHGLGSGADHALRGQRRAPRLWRTVRHRIWPRLRLALAREPLGTALAYGYLECVRAVAFSRGYAASARVMRTGTTSANG